MSLDLTKYKKEPLLFVLDRALRSMESMSLGQRFTTLAGLLKAIGENELAEKLIDHTPEAIEFDLWLHSAAKLYIEGEVSRIEIGDDAKKLIDLEAEAISRIVKKVIEVR